MRSNLRARLERLEREPVDRITLADAVRMHRAGERHPRARAASEAERMCGDIDRVFEDQDRMAREALEA